MKVNYASSSSAAPILEWNADQESFYDFLAPYLVGEIDRAQENPSYKGGDIDVEVSTIDGKAKYSVGLRSGTVCVTERSNTFPDAYVQEWRLKDRYLTCINEGRNSYKKYEMRLLPNHAWKAKWGRMAVAEGAAFGERSCEYPASMFAIKLAEKLAKGYVDRSEIMLAEDQVTPSKKAKTTSPVSRTVNTASTKLFTQLRALSSKAVEAARVMVPITQVIIDESARLIEEMRKASTVTEFNKLLMDLASILQRPVATGHGDGVRQMLARSIEDKGFIIERETDLLEAMKGTRYGSVADASTQDFGRYGIEVYMATPEQRELVMKKLGESLRGKVKNVYRVIPQAQKKKFDTYLAKRGIKDVKLLWHGSRNENWMSIIQESLRLNPNAVITGKMWGYGCYFAPSSAKSFNYTSYQGTTWAHGSSSTAFMGLFAVAYGKPYEPGMHSGGQSYESIVRNGGYDSLHARAEKTGLRNDEIVVYNESAMLLEYIVEFN